MVSRLYILYFISLLLMVNYLLLEKTLKLEPADNSNIYQSAQYYNCVALINETSNLLGEKNITKTCSLLKPTSCGFILEKLQYDAMPEVVFSRSASCDSLEFPKQTTGFDAEEEEYPLSYSIMTHGDARHFELLIKKIFRPFNHYCIHVDPRADKLFQTTINLIIDCYKNRFNLSNIFTVENPIPVYWGHLSVLEADLLCMKALLKKAPSWKALVILAGSEFPRYANMEFVRRSKQSKSVYIETGPMSKERYNKRLAHYFVLQDTGFHPDKTKLNKPRATSKKRPNPPFGLKLYTGFRGCILPRFWVSFLLFHPVSKEFIDWSKDSAHGEEHVFHTITSISNVTLINMTWVVEQEDGDGDAKHSPKVLHSVRQAKKAMKKGDYSGCHGIRRNGHCVLSMYDLAFILDPGNMALITNKFQSNIDPWIVPCLSEII